MAEKIKLSNVRLAFPDLFVAKASKNDTGGEGALKYSAAFLMPKDHPQMDEIDKAVKRVVKEKWGEKAQSVLNDLRINNKLLVKDGDGKSDYAGYPGNFFINSNNDSRPTVLDRDRTPLVAADGKLYSGCYVNAVIEIWAQDNKYGKRVNATLMGVQFKADGEAFSGGGVATSDDFEDESEDGGTSEEDLI